MSAANIELENNSTSPSGDMTRVFGSGSPEWNEAVANPAQAQADFVGIAIHCAKDAALCNTPTAKPDDATTVPGSDDGYIRDYDVFAGVNGKVLLTAPQRHHCGVMEGVIKAAQIRCWWENPSDLRNLTLPLEETPLCAPYSMLMQSDALWSLAGTDVGPCLS